ncbi:MAG: aminoglycoside phosphotransferase family protein [Eubacterium sp.]|nr:aminoglycoside phosphotransferase family protein [Eubacterium sp.]
MENVAEILKEFDFAGELVSYKLFGSGHINTTYIVTYDEGATKVRYILQRVNTNVFKNIDELMENVFAVTSFLMKKIEAEGGNPDRETLHYFKTKDGSKYYSVDGGAYRAYRFVEKSKSYDSADTPELFGKSGEAFGRFQRRLSDFPAETLYETIPNFHNTMWRFENEFLPALEEDREGRADECREETEFIIKRRGELSRLTDMIENGDLPLRVTHNDTKLNNVMFDEDTDEAICVIDLDTVMPGLALYDFGDSVRFGASTAAEDEKDVGKVSLDLDYFRAYAVGYLSQAGGILTDNEKDNLAFSAKLLTLELAMRFLTDYLNGDTYFKTDYPKHNLVRARAQLALVNDMERKMPEMEKIISEL